MLTCAWNLERVPRRLRRKLEIAHVRAETQTGTGADRHHHDAAGRQGRHADAADQRGRTVHAAKTLINRASGRQAVHQHHGAGAFAAHVPAERRTLPIDAQVARVLGVERAFAITQAADDRAAAFLPEDVTVGLAPGRKRALDHARKLTRHATEEAVTGIEDFVRRVAFGR